MAEKYICPICGRKTVERGGAGDDGTRVPGPPYCANGHPPVQMTRA